MASGFHGDPSREAAAAARSVCTVRNARETAAGTRKSARPPKKARSTRAGDTAASPTSAAYAMKIGRTALK